MSLGLVFNAFGKITLALRMWTRNLFLQLLDSQCPATQRIKFKTHKKSLHYYGHVTLTSASKKWHDEYGWWQTIDCWHPVAVICSVMEQCWNSCWPHESVLANEQEVWMFNHTNPSASKNILLVTAINIILWLVHASGFFKIKNLFIYFVLLGLYPIIKIQIYICDTKT